MAKVEPFSGFSSHNPYWLMADKAFISFLPQIQIQLVYDYLEVIAYLLYIPPLCVVIHRGCLCIAIAKKDVLVNKSATRDVNFISVAVKVEDVLSLSEPFSITHTDIFVCVRVCRIPLSSHD